MGRREFFGIAQGSALPVFRHDDGCGDDGTGEASAAGFVEAAVGAGASRWGVLSRHLLGHVLSRALLATVLMVPHAIMHESALSFLGLGLQDDRASLGTLIEQSRSAVLAGHWWPAVLPGLVLVLLSLAVYWLAERLRPVSVGRS